MSRKMKGGELTLFFILGGAAALVGLLIILNLIHANSVLQVKKTITLSTDLSDQGTAVLSLLNREHQGKRYISVLGESVAENYDSQPQDAYNSLKQTLKTMEEHFGFEFREKPLGLDLKYTPTSPEYGECGHTEPALEISLTWPSETERVTSGFGYRNAPRPCYCHSGLDIASGQGSDDVRAAYDGTVVFLYGNCKESPNCFLEPDNANCGCGSGYGNRITLKHTSPGGNEFYTHYCHLSEISAGNKQEVRAGQVIAKTGNTGRSEATHLHFELSTDKDMKDDDAINPCPYFDSIPSDCQQAETMSCGVFAGARTFNVEIPLPGAVAGKLKGKVVMEK